MRRLFMVLCAVGLMGSGVPGFAAPAPDTLEVAVTRAPVDPMGDVAGAATDLVVTFRDIDPSVPGIGLLTGGTVSI